MTSDPFAPVDGRGTSAKSAGPSSWATIMPVPADAPKPPASHPKLGKPVATWCYRDAVGAVNGYVSRFETADGKVFRPLTYARALRGGKPVWRWESWPLKRPLYQLEMLAERPEASVVVTEGEKAADAASALLPSFVVVTSPNGSKSGGKADWSPLRGRRVTIWPDADVAGLEYARIVAKESLAAGAIAVAIISPPHDCAVGWDAADALADGWDERRATTLVTDAQPAPNGGAGQTDGGSSGRRRTPQRDILVDLTTDCEFWHDGNRVAFATFPVARHYENAAIRSREFRMWLSERFFKETESAIGRQATEDSVTILEARAVYEGPEYPWFIRVGQQPGRIYLDLCDDRWRAIEVTRDQWRIIERPPVKFLRSPSMRPLPEPEPGGMIEELRRFVNVSESEHMLLVAWAVATLRPSGPYPILVVNAEQGGGKSVLCRMLRALVDPSAAPIRTVPRDDRDLIISASNSHMMAFDNLSSVPAWLADALCRLSTGGGFATRTLHTDREETIFEGQRPILLNGIPMLTERADLASRAITIHLKAIPDGDRRPEDELWGEFEAARPRILSALLNAVSAALRHMPHVKLTRAARMADFEKWATAAESCLGCDPGAFQRAYHENRRDISESSFEADPVAVMIRDLVSNEHSEGFTGTATELLAALNARASESVRKLRIWPGTAQGLGNRIDRIAPLLRDKGFSVERRHSGVRNIIIVPPKQAS
jgi:putative DNA primase/helicase